MNVLIARQDLFKNTTLGGGETFYRSIILNNKNMNFYYPSECADLEMPPFNAFPVDMSSDLYKDSAVNMALAFSGREFDVIDVPDFYRGALTFLGSCAHFGVSAKTIALSLHGRSSNTWKHGWETADPEILALEMLTERSLYRYVDVRYGISRAYIDELAEREGRKAHFLDPVSLYDGGPLVPREAPGSSLPSLLFIGRSDRIKGSDLFVDLISNISPDLYSEAILVGPYPEDVAKILSVMAFRRGVSVRCVGPLPHDEIMKLFSGRSVLLVTSRYETLSLTAMEGLLSGCPTAIASHLGTNRALEEEFPGIPYVKIPLNEPIEGAGAVNKILKNYDFYRNLLVEYLKYHKHVRSGVTISEIYNYKHDFDQDIRDEIHDYAKKRINESINMEKKEEKDANMSKKSHVGLIGCCSPPMQLHLSVEQNKFIFQTWAREVGQWMSLYDRYVRMPETGADQIDQKWQFLAALCSAVQVDRVRRTRELARLERKRGRQLVAAAYELRIMRWLGEDRFNAVGSVADALMENGFEEEASVAKLMFGDVRLDGRDGMIRQYLQSRLTKHLSLPAPSFVRTIDNRLHEGYRVSVIVSLYNTGNKLPRFLRALTRQSLFSSGKMEIILLDSDSPQDESVRLISALGEHSPHIGYFRTTHRETIQCAWNRGIGLSQAPYLLFLGVDEEIRPDACELLAGELDKFPEIDWVQGSAVVFDVDRDGMLVRDTGCYDRKWSNADAQYLDTTYLGHVVGLYRKSLHDRVGLYDPNFRGAGDTEFKNRALPYLRAKSIPTVLGRYVNYPEERTTASCNVELEDLRAWYVHRTRGGIDYAFGDRDTKDLEALIPAALQHHKCYRTHISSDADLAVLASDLLAEKDPASHMLQYRDGAHALQSAWRQLDFVQGDWPIERSDCLSPEILSGAILSAGQEAMKIARQHGRLRSLGYDDDYHFANDNRWEQHYWVWQS